MMLRSRDLGVDSNNKANPKDKKEALLKSPPTRISSIKITQDDNDDVVVELDKKEFCTKANSAASIPHATHQSRLGNDDGDDGDTTSDSSKSKISGNNIDTALLLATHPKTQLSPASSPAPKRRRSSRDTNSVRLSHKSSLQYRRLHELFFHPVPPPLTTDTASASADCNAGNNNVVHIGRHSLVRVSHDSSPTSIYTIPNFLSPNELQYLHEAIQRSKFQRSFVDAMPDNDDNDNDTNNTQQQASLSDATNNNNGSSSCCCDTATAETSKRKNSSSSRTARSLVDDTHRTSTFVSFRAQQDSVICALERKAAALLGCWSSQTVEPLQLVRYTPGQWFGVHHDMGDYNEDTGHVSLPPRSAVCKRRLVTLFCYLNDDVDGGATHFPNAKSSNDNDESSSLRVHPVTGTAVLFSNILENGLPDPNTIHAGERVTQGIKYGLNIWMCED